VTELDEREDGRLPSYTRYSPHAWLVSCEASQERSARKRRQLRRYQLQAWSAIFAVLALWAGILYALGLLV
jgi:hypothetical protein